MAIGDVTDFQGRIARYLTQRWFPDLASAPILNAVVTGAATVAAGVYALIAYARLQARISTATDGWLDLIAYDFFGTRILRRANESDATFRLRILAEILRERATRKAIIQTLSDLTGRAPLVFEPWRPADAGGWSQSGFAWGQAGGWGSILCHAQFFVQAKRPANEGVAYIGGYGGNVGAYGTGSQIEWTSPTDAVSDAAIYAAVDATTAAGVLAWVNISS